MGMTAVTETFVPTRFPKRAKSVRLHIKFENEPDKITAEEFWEFCQENPQIRAELTKNGDIIVMPPTGSETGDKNAEITMQLRLWAKRDQTGKTYDSSTGFKLSSGAIVSPDASWVSMERLNRFTAEQREKFLPLCPDFVIELRSFSDNLKDAQKKLQDYIESGARLGWLIDPKNRRVHIYRANGEIEILENPDKVSGENVLNNFELDLTEIW